MTSIRTTPVQPSSPNAQTIIDMFALGWFGQGPPFWRWIETEAAQPYIRACAAMRRAPQPGDVFDVFADDAEMSAIEDPDHLAALAASIEAEYGDANTMDTP